MSVPGSMVGNGGSDIPVYIRFRPMNKLEISRRSRNCVTYHSTSGDDVTRDLTVDSPMEGEYDFSFDKVFKEKTAQEDVYNETTSPLAQKLVDGYNTALIAFGQSGSGKTYTMMGENPMQHHSKMDNPAPNQGDDSQSCNDRTGIIPRAIKEIFQLMNKASPIIEFTVRVSFVEVYLEQIRDLLNPSKRFLKLKDGEDRSEYEMKKGPILEGLCEVCCLSWTEVVSLLFKGNAFRVVSEQQKQTDLNQSHTIFTIKLEQRNLATERTITSKMHLVDLAGSEVERQLPRSKIVRSPRSPTASPVQQQEIRIINQSHLGLKKVLNALGRFQRDKENPRYAVDPNLIPYKDSKLTRILCNALGGNCYTSFLMTATAATFNISSTVATMRYAEKIKVVKNYPYLNIEASPEECNIELEKSKKIQSELLVLIKEIGSEMRRIKDKGETNSIQDEGPLWEKLNEICESNKYFVYEEDQGNDNASNLLSITLHDEIQKKDEEIVQLKSKLAETREARDKAQSLSLEMEGECVFLRNESEEVLAAKKRNTEDIIDAQNEIQLLSQRRLELEHNLRTSQFRENEAVAFTRHFRRFYRKLLQNNAKLSSGSPEDIILKMTGVPNLDDLIDIDVLLCESGLLEDYEVNSDTDDGPYKPSVNSLVRSSALASKAKRQAMLNWNGAAPNSIDNTSITTGSRYTLSTHSESDGEGALGSTVVSPLNSSRSSTRHVELESSSMLSDPLLLHSPSEKLNNKRMNELERDLLRITRRCIDLQTCLYESEEWVEILSMRGAPTNKKDDPDAQIVELKNSLSKKESDLQALVWKMNEIHLINKQYNDTLSAREQHAYFLEEQLSQFQHKLMMQSSIHEETERKLRTEIMRLNSLIDAMTKIHWSSGKKSNKRLESRIIIPFQGGSSLDTKTREQLLEYKQMQQPPHQMRSGRTLLSEASSKDDGRTSAGISYAPSTKSMASSIFVDQKSLLDQKSQLSLNSKSDDISFATRPPIGGATSDGIHSRSKDMPHTHLNSLAENESKTIPSLFLVGGKNILYQPRSFTKKVGSNILPGILKSPSKPSNSSELQSFEDSGTLQNRKLEVSNQSTSSPKRLSSPKTKTGQKNQREILTDRLDRQKSLSDTRRKLDELESAWSNQKRGAS
mmetsp:Transcript_8266/g.10488  ORF Transcript_8266/g.10488 Transcript_8266/m.10488 type:complete len:1144 (+) Transcript_8266:213-3644(+)